MSDHHFALRLDLDTEACPRKDVPDLPASAELSAVPLESS